MEYTVLTAAVGHLGQRFDGDLRQPGDEGFDDARKVWNCMFDCRPALVARCRSVGDVVAAVNSRARAHSRSRSGAAGTPPSVTALATGFVQQMGGTAWAGVQTQYYQTDSSGAQQYVTNPGEQLAGIWVDDSNTNTLPKTSMSNPAGSTNTLTMLGQEAQAAASHFGITDLNDANIVIMQPPGLSDPNALSQGYCAFHDYTWPGVASGVYNGITQGISYSNIPYQLAINSGGANVCGENAVNSDARGKLDGDSIVLGHEIEETVTDPGAEDVIGSTPTYLGGWYDTVDANENGDKCAWVGENLVTGTGPAEPIPGALGDINGNAGARFAVQSLWSNAANEGTGYCAGSGNESPLPSG